MVVTRVPLAAVVWTMVAAGVCAAGQHVSHAIPVLPAELLERNVPLRTGIGARHDAVTTSSVDAQRFYDQGLAYLHHYVWIEAARSFHQALHFDPDLALAFVGLSYAYSELGRPQDAQSAIDRARGLSSRVSDHDRQHIALREAQLDAEQHPQDVARFGAYRRALDEALATMPHDAELWLLRGMAEAPTASDRGQLGTATSVPFYARALALAPDDAAAHHYLTHAYENAGRIDDALRHGAAYARAAPNIPHARHMHGHDLRRAGRVQEAIAEFEAADRLAVEYFASERVQPEYDWHYEHNLGLLAMSYQHAGQVGRAEPLFQKAFALPTAFLVQAFNKRGWPRFLRSRGRTDEALAAARTLTTHPHPVVQALGHVEGGHAYLMKRQFKDVAAASNAARRLLMGDVPGSGVMTLPFEELQGEFFLRTGQAEKGRSMLRGAIERGRALTGPDEWSYALFMLESIARAARDVGDWEFAGWVTQHMLAHDPSYAGTHYALALVASHAGDLRTAAAELELAIRHWSHADPALPELRDARARLRLLTERRSPLASLRPALRPECQPSRGFLRGRRTRRS